MEEEKWQRMGWKHFGPSPLKGSILVARPSSTGTRISAENFKNLQLMLVIASLSRVFLSEVFFADSFQILLELVEINKVNKDRRPLDQSLE